jgi:hypothetical protein
VWLGFCSVVVCFDFVVAALSASICFLAANFALAQTLFLSLFLFGKFCSGYVFENICFLAAIFALAQLLLCRCGFCEACSGYVRKHLCFGGYSRKCFLAATRITFLWRLSALRLYPHFIFAAIAHSAFCVCVAVGRMGLSSGRPLF